MGIYTKVLNESYNIMTFLNEAYIGKNNTLKEIEDLIGELRANLNKFADLNKSEEVLKINRLFEKQFGMEVFALQVSKLQIKNAFTYPIGSRFDIALKGSFKDKVVADKKNGYRFKPNNGLCIICSVTYGLLADTNFTNGEILAIILHEIGHNFADAISNDIALANRNNAISILILKIFSTLMSKGMLLPAHLLDLYKGSNSYIMNVEKSNNRQSKFRGVTSGISASVTNVLNNISDFCSRIFGGIQYKPDMIIYKIFGKKQMKGIMKSVPRQNEVIADKFAGIYGYGVEQSSALIKTDASSTPSEELINKIPVIGPLLNNAYFNNTKQLLMYNCHPNTIQRIGEEIKTLQYELEKSDIDPKVVKVLNKQIEQMIELQNKIQQSSPDDSKLDVSRALFYGYINEELPDALDEEIEKSINKSFDDLLK